MVSLEQLGFQRLLRKRGRDLQVLGPGGEAGVSFRGTINRAGSFDLVTDLGVDKRGQRILEVPLTAPELTSQSYIKDLATNEQYQVVQIDLADTNYSRKYELKANTAADA